MLTQHPHRQVNIVYTLGEHLADSFGLMFKIACQHNLSCELTWLKSGCMQVLARTICMQFEGNWTPVTDIVVDKVGKYAYVIGSPHDAAATPVVMDVVLDVRTKVQMHILCSPYPFWSDCIAQKTLQTD